MIQYTLVSPVSSFAYVPDASGAGVLVARDTTAFYSSADGGATWVQRQLCGQPYRVVWSGNAFYAASYDFPNYLIWRSYDGIVWSIVQSSDTVYMTVVGAGNGIVYLSDTSSYSVYASTDGVSLQPTTLSFPITGGVSFLGVEEIIHSTGSNYVARSGPIVMTSYDGLSFVEINFPQYNTLFYSTYRNLFFAIIVDGMTFDEVAAYSSDLISWSPISIDPPINAWVPIFIESGGYLAICSYASSEAPADVRFMAPGSQSMVQLEPDEFGEFPIPYYGYWAPGANQGEFLLKTGGPFIFNLAMVSLSVPSAFWTNFKGQYEL